MSDLLPPPESEVKPASLTEAIAMPAGGKQLTLWGDVWRKLKRDKRFWVASIMVGIFVLMAIAPAAVPDEGPEPVPYRRQRARMSKAHWFGTDILGCDYYSRVIYGAQDLDGGRAHRRQPDDRDRPHARARRQDISVARPTRSYRASPTSGSPSRRSSVRSWSFRSSGAAGR